MELGELHRTIHGRTAEREVASGEMYRKTRKHECDAMSKTSDLAHPGLDLVSGGEPAPGPHRVQTVGVCQTTPLGATRDVKHAKHHV